MPSPEAPLSFTEFGSALLNRNLIFVSGKGGVGKTMISQSLAKAYSALGKKTLWVTFEDPHLPEQKLIQKDSHLWHLNAEAMLSFEEYVGIKVKFAKLASLFVHHPVMKYLIQVAPGIRELVLLGKIWHERTHYDHIVVDMPATGHGLVMFQSTRNFSKLFRGGPIHRDADEMLNTFGDPKSTAHLIVALPEEMPLQESLELHRFLIDIFPSNPSAFLVNRRLKLGTTSPVAPNDADSPVPHSLSEFLKKRAWLENQNLSVWRNAGLRFGEMPWVGNESTQEHLSKIFAEKIS